MINYYHIAKLRANEGVTFTPQHVRVNLDVVTEHDHIRNDEDLLASAREDVFFYLSGGGTLLLNERYLLMVRRDATARVNPSILSLFTGRADSIAEWYQPPRVARELFEELRLYQGDCLLVPTHPEFQTMIDATRLPTPSAAATPLPLEKIPLESTRLMVTARGTTMFDARVHLHVNSRRDMNLIYCFKATVDMDTLRAEDGEYDRNEEIPPRCIMALDLQANELLELSCPPSKRTRWKADAWGYSEHLKHTLELLKLQYPL